MTVATTGGAIDPMYRALEERIMDRDQVGASEVYYGIHQGGRPLTEQLQQAVRIHGPYTHVPYHERIDDGYVNFVNNDHCLLSARATLGLADKVSPELAGLPMAQTIWYIPTGLDIWNQKLIKAPGHYARGYEMPPGPPPVPVVHWPDQEPAAIDGDYGAALERWVTLVHRGQVLEAYALFLGLMADKANRRRALAQLAFSGLMDVQDRVFLNRSYTTGHRAYRARATVELGDAIGWDDAHDVLYAGAPDLAVGPRWYSTYEHACNAIKVMIDGEVLRAVPYAGASDRERALWQNSGALSTAEAAETEAALIRGPEPGNLEQVARLLQAGKSPCHIIDVIQAAAAQVVLETRDPKGFSIPQHCYEYCNTVRWYFDSFSHTQQLKLLFMAASFVNRNAQHQRDIGEMTRREIEVPAGAAAMDEAARLAELDRALLQLDQEAAVAWTRASLMASDDRGALTRCLADAATKIGNDPHNQEIALCFLEDYGRSTAPDRDRLLLACAQHTAAHQKYGDYLECYHRYCAAFGLTPSVAAAVH